MAPILEVLDLRVAYHSPSAGPTTALAGVSFSVEAGEILGVLGESGSGKSSLAAALLRMLPSNGSILAGSVRFECKDLLSASQDELVKIRGARISLIFQEPGLALHPAMRVRDQVGEVVRAHQRLSAGDRKKKTGQILDAVFPSEASRISSSYPHQLSGGQRQRVLLAQAIACGPAVLIADEPTASLDPTTQKGILELLGRLRRELCLTLVLITHNPALLAGFADRILVLYAGAVAEWGPAEEVLARPLHPYSEALLDCLPSPSETGAGKIRLPVIAGDAPDMTLPFDGCRFEPRCPARMGVCRERAPGPTRAGAAHSVSCFKFGG
jgi:oligopeptide/dipeptide ABC transporter ATP-binding protein